MVKNHSTTKKNACNMARLSVKEIHDLQLFWVWQLLLCCSKIHIKGHNPGPLPPHFPFVSGCALALELLEGNVSIIIQILGQAFTGERK